MDLESELEKFMFELYEKVNQRQPVVFEKIMKQEERCLQDAGDDVESYVNCMRKISKQAAYNEHMMAYRTEYAIKKATTCFHENAKSNKSFAPCKEMAFSQIEKYLKDLSNSF